MATFELDSDPVPGDPGQLGREAAHLSQVATTITDQIKALRQIADSGADESLKGQYADTIRSSATGLADQLGKVVGRYQKASTALSQWVPEVNTSSQLGSRPRTCPRCTPRPG
jgi:hypothetical protein